MIFAIRTDEEILGVPNASMVSVMLDWFTELLPGDGSIRILDDSEETSIIAIQGPKSMEIVSQVLGDSNNVGRFKCQDISQNNLSVEKLDSRNGICGEPGVEIFIPNDQASLLWKRLVISALVEAIQSDWVLETPSDSRKATYCLVRISIGRVLVSWQTQIFLKDFCPETPQKPPVPFGLNMSHEFIGRERVLGLLKTQKNGRRLDVLGGPLPSARASCNGLRTQKMHA